MCHIFIPQTGGEAVTERLTRSERRNDYPAPAYLPPSVDWTERGKQNTPDLSEDIFSLDPPGRCGDPGGEAGPL